LFQFWQNITGVVHFTSEYPIIAAILRRRSSGSGRSLGNQRIDTVHFGIGT
jgi:hypothetical protein